MKKLRMLLAVAIAALMAVNVQAQNPKNAEVKIKVSSQCNECKETIERTLAFEKGVVKSDLDLETNVVTVVYKTARTAPDKIRTAISNAGYDADDVPADVKAYKNLSDCCKKPEDRESDHSGHGH